MSDPNFKEGMEILNKMQSLIYSDLCAVTIKKIAGRDIVILLGNTRAGKSTIVHYIIGNTLTAIHIKKKNYHIVASDVTGGPVISGGALSETTIPTAWASSKLQELIVDTPGFGDNRGVAQDVANTFYIKELLSNARSIKFVLLSDINDLLMDNIGHFTEFLDKIYTMIPECDTLRTGMIMVFNKDKEDTTKDEICDHLRKKVLKQTGMDFKNRCLIEYMANNPNHIVICSMPDRPGEIQEGTVFSDMVNVINKNAIALPKDLMSTIKPGISDRSKAFLLYAHSHFSEATDFDVLLTGVLQVLNQRMEAADFNHSTASTDQLRVIKGNLRVLEERIRTVMDARLPVKETLLEIGKILPTYAALKEDSEAYRKLKFIQFVDMVLDINESTMYMIKIDTTLSKMKDKVVNRIIDTQERLLEITVAEANAKYDSLQKEIRAIQDTNNQKLAEMKRVQDDLIARQKQQTQVKRCSIL